MFVKLDQYRAQASISKNKSIKVSNDIRSQVSKLGGIHSSSKIATAKMFYYIAQLAKHVNAYQRPSGTLQHSGVGNKTGIYDQHVRAEFANDEVYHRRRDSHKKKNRHSKSQNPLTTEFFSSTRPSRHALCFFFRKTTFTLH